MKFLRIILIYFIIFFLGAGSAFADNSYEIEVYVATITLADRSEVMDVDLEIFYRIEGVTVSRGSHSIGRHQVFNIFGNDERSLLDVYLLEGKENKLVWSFSPVSSGEEKVWIKFKLKGALSYEKRSNILSLPWVGDFKIPVRYAQYRVVFPIGVHPEIQNASSPYNMEEDKYGRSVLIVDQNYPSVEPGITIVFSPAIVEVPMRFGDWIKKMNIGPAFLTGCFALFFLFLLMRSRRKARRS